MLTVSGMIQSENWMFATRHDDEFVSHSSAQGPCGLLRTLDPACYMHETSYERLKRKARIKDSLHELEEEDDLYLVEEDYECPL